MSTGPKCIGCGTRFVSTPDLIRHINASPTCNKVAGPTGRGRLREVNEREEMARELAEGMERFAENAMDAMAMRIMERTLEACKDAARQLDEIGETLVDTAQQARLKGQLQAWAWIGEVVREESEKLV